MTRPIPPALLAHYEAEVYRCPCGSWAIGKQPCETCIALALNAIQQRTDRAGTAAA